MRKRMSCRMGIWIAAVATFSLAKSPVGYKLVTANEQMVATIDLPGEGQPPKEIQVSFRTPEGRALVSITANGHELPITGRNKDAALIATNGHRRFEVVAAMR